MLNGSRLLVSIALVSLLFVGACSSGSDDETATPEPTASQTGETGSPVRDETATPNPTEDPLAVDGGAVGADATHDGDRAMEHVRVLAGEIGPRVSGSLSAAEAVSYIRDTFATYGYAVEVMDFEYDASVFRPGTVSVGGEIFDAIALDGSTDGTVEAPASDIGSGDDAAVSGLSFAGNIAIAGRDDVLFQLKHTNAAAGGAVGLIIVNEPDRPFRGGNLLELAAMPVVLVEEAAAGAIATAIASGEAITITVTPSSSTPAANVIARPAEGARCDILVGGHHDSVPGAPGANDNASGSSNVLELARAFASDGLDDGLCFATFGAEESGLNGSRALAALWDSTGELPRFMVNFDVTGNGDLVELIGVGTLVDRGLAIAEDIGIPAAASSLPPNTGSDHQSFAARDVPVLFLTSGDFSEIHGPNDVVDIVEVADLDRVGDLGLAVLVDLLEEIAAARAQT